MHKVSIVTISFNQAEYLQEAIESVLQQDYPDIEYIVVDPGSRDGSREIIERYRSRISRIVYEPDLGPADGLNHGFRYATGTVYAYLNADDLLLPGAVSSAAGMLENSDLAVVYGDGYFIDGDDKVLRRCFSSNFSARRYALGAAMIMQQSSFWRADWHRKVGGFKLENRTCWDGEFFFQVALAGGKFRHVPQYWSCFRIHGDSITGSGRVTAEYNAYQRKMFAPHLERHGRLLPLHRAAARLMKHVENPRILACKLAERVFGAPSLPKPRLS
ncbi:MAG TPA: glycosyltransferase family 2 protein [Acidisarcina sp.]